MSLSAATITTRASSVEGIEDYSGRVSASSCVHASLGSSITVSFVNIRPLSRLAVDFMATLAIFAAYCRLSRDFRGGGGLAFSRRLSRLSSGLSCSSVLLTYYKYLIIVNYGLRDNVLEWFRSYLSDRTFRVVYGGNTSRTVVIFCSVPQVSVLRLRLFILYTGDLADEIDRHDVNFHAYADDS